MRSHQHIDTPPADSERCRLEACPDLAVHLIGHSVSSRDRIVQAASETGTKAISYRLPEDLLAAKPAKAGCVVSAFQLPAIGGFEFQQRLQAVHPELPIIFVDRAPTIPDVVRAMRAGAASFLSEPWSQSEMRVAIAEALAEARERRARTIRRLDADARFSRLDAIDAAVLELLLQGAPNKAVAARLGIGLRTVERRRASALRALGTSSLVEAVALRAELEEFDAPAGDFGQRLDVPPGYTDAPAERSSLAMNRPATSKWSP